MQSATKDPLFDPQDVTYIVFLDTDEIINWGLYVIVSDIDEGYIKILTFNNSLTLYFDISIDVIVAETVEDFKENLI